MSVVGIPLSKRELTTWLIALSAPPPESEFVTNTTGPEYFTDLL
jgi:hypothetical protein